MKKNSLFVSLAIWLIFSGVLSSATVSYYYPLHIDAHPAVGSGDLIANGSISSGFTTLDSNACSSSFSNSAYWGVPSGWGTQIASDKAAWQFECYVDFTTISTTEVFFSFNTSAGCSGEQTYQITSGNAFGSQMTYSGGCAFPSGGTASTHSWTQYDMSYDGTTYRLYVGGTLVASSANGAFVTPLTNNGIVGTFTDNTILYLRGGIRDVVWYSGANCIGSTCGPYVPSTPTPTNTPASTPTYTPTITPTSTPTATPTVTPTPSPTFTITVTASSTPTATPVCTSLGQLTPIGNNSIGNGIIFFKLITLNNATVQTVSAYVSKGYGAMEAALYTDYNGAPFSLVKSSNLVYAISTGWNSVTLSTTFLTPGPYWLAVEITNTGAIQYSTVGTDKFQYQQFGSWPTVATPQNFLGNASIQGFTCGY